MDRRRFLAAGAAACGVLTGCQRIPWELPEEGTTTERPATTRTTPEETTETRTTRETTTRQSTTRTTTTTTTRTATVSRGVTNGSFEDGLRGWEAGRDLPEDPNNPGEKVDSEVRTAPGRASEGQRALLVAIDGSQDDGTVWLKQRVDLSGIDSLTVDAYSARSSFNTLSKLAVYTGPERDLTEGAFDTSQAIEDHRGWRSFTYPVDHDGVGLVAVGVSVVWETRIARLLDGVTVRPAD